LRGEWYGEESNKVKVLKHVLLLLGIAAGMACRSAEPAPKVPPTAAVPPTSQAATMPTDTPIPSLLGVAWHDRAPFIKGLIAEEQTVLQQLQGASVYHIDLQVADDLLRLSAQQQVRYTNQETQALDEVYFRLFANLFGAAVEVSSVSLDGTEVTPAYELANSAMRVALPSPLLPGGAVTFDILFSVDLPLSAAGNYGIFGLMDNILALAHFYPMVAVYDDEGWNVEIAPEYGDVVYADSSFYLVRVLAPSRLTLVASGVEIDRQNLGDRQQVTYAAGPMRDFYLVASQDYLKVSRTVGETTVNSYAPAALAKGAEAALQHTVNALRIFAARYGDYPFTEFDVVATPTLALGVEYPGIVAMAQRLYPPQTDYGPEYLESTMAHEVAHQWFYSLIGNDQLDEPWLDEAVTQYATLLYYLDLYGPGAADGFRSSLYSRWQRVDQAAIAIGMPVRAYSSSEYGAIVYGRGPLFLERLSTKMGQEAFATFLRDYSQTFKWSVATGQGFKELAESYCRCDLTALFEEWVY
jgi:aminopeptidase N